MSTYPHTLEDREDGLANCLICGGAEASMPTDCPGTRMPIFRQDQVQRGSHDYRAVAGRGRWLTGRIVNFRFVPDEKV